MKASRVRRRLRHAGENVAAFLLIFGALAAMVIAAALATDTFGPVVGVVCWGALAVAAIGGMPNGPWRA